MTSARQALCVIPNEPGRHSGTPIFDGLHDELWPRPPVKYVSDEEFRRIYEQERSRWAGLIERLKD